MLPPPARTEQNGGRAILFTAVTFSFISAAALFLWGSAFGGVDVLVENAGLIRSGRLDPVNAFTFFKHFVPLSLLASWMLFTALISPMKKSLFKKLVLLIFLALSFFIAIIYLQANDGRMLVAVFVLLFFVIYIKQQYESQKTKMLPLLLKMGVILLITCVILFNADGILRMLRGQEQSEAENVNFLQTLATEFSFLIGCMQACLGQWANGNGQLMIGNDVVNGLFAWLPTSLKPVQLESVWTYNTVLLNTGGGGTMPTSIVAQSFYDLQWIGILLIPFLYGLLVQGAEALLSRRKGNVFYDTVYVGLGFYLGKGLPYFSLHNIMMNTFFLLIGTAIYFVIERVRVRKL